jgi:hypothetical protein
MQPIINGYLFVAGCGGENAHHFDSLLTYTPKNLCMETPPIAYSPSRPTQMPPEPFKSPDPAPTISQ